MIFITRPTSITIKGDSWERTCGGFKSPLMGLPVHCQSKKPQLLKENSRVTYIIALTAFIPNYRLYEIVVLFFPNSLGDGGIGKKRNMSDIFPHQHQEILFFLLLFLICHFAVFEFFIYWFYFYAKYFILRFV